MSKPELHTLGPNPTVEQIVALYTKLTGKEPTAEELNELKTQMVMGESHSSAMNSQGYSRVIQPDALLVNADWPKRTQDVKTPSLGFSLIEVLVVLAILAILVAMLIPTVNAVKAANARNAVSQKHYGYDGANWIAFDVIRLDGCEYLDYSDARGYRFTHKGNCSNPIHKYNSEQP